MLIKNELVKKGNIIELHAAAFRWLETFIFGISYESVAKKCVSFFFISFELLQVIIMYLLLFTGKLCSCTVRTSCQGVVTHSNT